MKRFLREPLLHFLLLGAILFALFYAVNDDRSSGAWKLDEVVVTQDRVTALSQKFTKVWQRPPTESERNALIDDFVREEIFYREALALGLDRDDTIVRRRMQQKMEFLTEDLLVLPDPSDKDLQGFLQTHPDFFQVSPRLSFMHVYLSADKHGTSIEAEAKTLLAELRKHGAAVDPSTVGDRLMLERQFTDASTSGIKRLFGGEFADGLLRIPTGTWQGPVASGYGLHLVYISERTDGRSPSLDEVRDTVTREWRFMRRQEANKAFYNKLRDRYKITIEKLEVPK